MYYVLRWEILDEIKIHTSDLLLHFLNAEKSVVDIVW